MSSRAVNRSFDSINPNASNSDISQQIATISRNRKQTCVVDEIDISNLEHYFMSMGINLYDKDTNYSQPLNALLNGYYVLIPTVMADLGRQDNLIRNIDTHLTNGQNAVILFFKQAPGVTSYYTQLVTKLNPAYLNRITYVTYTHHPIDSNDTKSHVGKARAAIGYYLLKYVHPDQIVVITDDRRYLINTSSHKIQKKKKPESNKREAQRVDKLNNQVIQNRIMELVNYIKVNPMTIISPISGMTGKHIRGQYGSNFVLDGDGKTYMMSQIYFGQMKTFVGIYACAYKNNAVCTMTNQGYRTTPTLSACFARLFEDCSFINAGYDNSFHMVSYKGLYRQTGKVESVARKVLNVADLDPVDVENLNEALESCVIYQKGKGNDLSDFWLRWGNHIEHLKAQLVCTDGKKDPYAYHKGCFATYKAYELDNYDTEPESSSGSDDNDSMDTGESTEEESSDNQMMEDVAPETHRIIRKFRVEKKGQIREVMATNRNLISKPKRKAQRQQKPDVDKDFEVYNPSMKVFDVDCVMYDEATHHYLIKWVPMWVLGEDLKGVSDSIEEEFIETQKIPTGLPGRPRLRYLVNWKPTLITPQKAKEWQNQGKKICK